MIPFGVHDVTLYHIGRNGDVTRHYLSGCSWKDGQERRFAYNDMMRKDGTVRVCRYPSEYPHAAPGDLFVLGHVGDVVTKPIFSALLEKYEGRCFLCETFADNTRGVLNHLCAKGA